MITSPEMDDLFRFIYPEEMKYKHIYQILKPFEVIANKILIEYRKFRTWLIEELKSHNKI